MAATLAEFQVLSYTNILWFSYETYAMNADGVKSAVSGKKHTLVHSAGASQECLQWKHDGQILLHQPLLELGPE